MGRIEYTDEPELTGTLLARQGEFAATVDTLVPLYAGRCTEEVRSRQRILVTTYTLKRLCLPNILLQGRTNQTKGRGNERTALLVVLSMRLCTR